MSRVRHSLGRAACLAHPPHTHPPKTNALAVEDVIDVVAVYGVDDERFLDRVPVGDTGAMRLAAAAAAAAAAVVAACVPERGTEEKGLVLLTPHTHRTKG